MLSTMLKQIRKYAVVVVAVTSRATLRQVSIVIALFLHLPRVRQLVCGSIEHGAPGTELNTQFFDKKRQVFRSAIEHW